MRPLITIVLALLFLAGCAVESLSVERPFEQLPDRTTAIAAGQSDRADVHAALGEPVLASRWWGFEVFRAGATQAQTAIALTPWPIPFARFEDEILLVTLVVYHPDGRVAALQSGPFRRPADWRNLSPIANDHPAVHLRAGDLLLFMDPSRRREINLLAAPALRDAYLKASAATEGCTALFACDGPACADQVAVDAGVPQELPLRTSTPYWLAAGARAAWLDGVEQPAGDPRLPWLDTLVALRMAPGAHTLVLSARHRAGQATQTLDCQRGATVVLTLSARAAPSFWSPELVDWRIETSDTLPPRFARRALVLVEEGRWLAAP